MVPSTVNPVSETSRILALPLAASREAFTRVMSASARNSIERPLPAALMPPAGPATVILLARTRILSVPGRGVSWQASTRSSGRTSRTVFDPLAWTGGAVQSDTVMAAADGGTTAAATNSAAAATVALRWLMKTSSDSWCVSVSCTVERRLASIENSVSLLELGGPAHREGVLSYRNRSARARRRNRAVRLAARGKGVQGRRDP